MNSKADPHHGEHCKNSFIQECKNDEQKLSEIFDPSLKKHRK